MMIARTRSWVESRPARRWIGLGVLAVAAAANYASWLGAHDHFYINSHGQYRGPYEPWQVIGFISVTVALLIAAGWQRLVVDAAIVVAAAVALTFAYYGDRKPGPDDGWRETLTIVIALGSFFAGWLVTSTSTWLRNRLRP